MDNEMFLWEAVDYLEEIGSDVAEDFNFITVDFPDGTSETYDIIDMDRALMDLQEALHEFNHDQAEGRDREGDDSPGGGGGGSDEAVVGISFS